MWDGINNFLAIIGLLSLGKVVIRTIWLFFQNTEWIDNVRIEEHSLDEELDNDTYYALDYYPGSPDCIDNEFASQNVFIPQNTIIKKVVVKKLKLEQEGDEIIEKYEEVHVFKNVSPHNPVCLVVERGECIPSYILEWKTTYGVTAQYFFGENGRNGVNSFSGFQYKVGLMAKVRKALDLP